MVIIKETSRQHSCLLQIDFGGVNWLIEGLKSAAYQFNERVLLKRYQASYAAVETICLLINMA